jgi:hypothetical protein
MTAVSSPGAAFPSPPILIPQHRIDLTGLCRHHRLQLQLSLRWSASDSQLPAQQLCWWPTDFATGFDPAPGTENDDKNPPRVAPRSPVRYCDRLGQHLEEGQGEDQLEAATVLEREPTKVALYKLPLHPVSGSPLRPRREPITAQTNL